MVCMDFHTHRVVNVSMLINNAFKSCFVQRESETVMVLFVLRIIVMCVHIINDLHNLTLLNNYCFLRF